MDNFEFEKRESLLHRLQPCQTRFLCGDADFGWGSVHCTATIHLWDWAANASHPFLAKVGCLFAVIIVCVFIISHICNALTVHDKYKYTV